mmetsp:Transcript_2334/g.2910  ORF Transcript_2334/g.2910 Transcript_2334/m.2910 type:complete len:188 (+) Transcript_2334:124-687(+)|eukprot:jgi/Bigna1/85034/estExt_fgenesh1_pg.C_10638
MLSETKRTASILASASSLFDLTTKFDDEISFTTMDAVQQEWHALEEDGGRKDKKGNVNKPVHVLLFGCKWCYPSYATLKHAHEIFHPKKSLRSDKVSTLKEEFGDLVHLHLIDQEEDREYCDRHDIMVGSSVMFVTTSSGDNLLFKRLTWPLNDRVIGPFNKISLKAIIKASIKAAQSGKSNVAIDV